MRHMSSIIFILPCDCSFGKGWKYYQVIFTFCAYISFFAPGIYTWITSCFHITLHVWFPIKLRVSLSLWRRVSQMKCHFPVNKLYFMTQSRPAEKISHGTRCYCLSNFHVIFLCPSVSITCLFLVINLHVIKYSERNGTKLRQATTK